MKRKPSGLEGATTNASTSDARYPPFWLEGESPIESLAPDPRNPRKMDAAAANGLSASLEEFGALDIVFNEELGQLVSGHQRISTLARDGAKAVVRTSSEWGHIEHPKTKERFPVRFVRWDKEKHTVANMVANNPHIQGQFTPDALGLLREMTHDRRYLALELHKLEDDLAAELAAAEATANANQANEAPSGPGLAERFGVPPFSVLDTRQGYWQDRKRGWLSLGIQSELGRAAAPAGGGGVYQDVGSIGDRYGKKGKLAKNTKRHGATFREDIMRGERVVDKGGTATQAGAPDGGNGTSIFDPVLCELAYRWFSPEGGVVLDPFAGGSVRGVVAAALGRKYTGIELRGEQVQANRDQWAEIAPALARAAAERAAQPKVTPAETTIPSDPNTEPRTVRVSAAMARLPFAGCSVDYIRDVCKAKCCHAPSRPTGTLITIHPSEEAAIAARGGIVVDGLLQPKQGEKRCPFKARDTELCGLHTTPDKPFGCIASPFTLNNSGTLIVRNRYKLLPCYKGGAHLPAYKAFAESLVKIFGAQEAARITEHLDADGGDIDATMPAESYRMLVENDAIKHGDDASVATRAATVPGNTMGRLALTPDAPQWIEGDSTNLRKLAKGLEADLLFTCPPYADLEVYSDDPRDISTMPYGEFREAYGKIIREAAAKLKPDRFAVVVVGEVRGGSDGGKYYGFVPDTIRAFTEAGLAYYNELILVTAVGSLPIRAGKQMQVSRKIGKTHQNVLVFVKGNPKTAAAACGTIDLVDPTADTDEEPEVNDA